MLATLLASRTAARGSDALHACVEAVGCSPLRIWVGCCSAAGASRGGWLRWRHGAAGWAVQRSGRSSLHAQQQDSHRPKLL